MKKKLGGTKRLIAIMLIATLVGGIFGYGIGTIISHGDFSAMNHTIKAILTESILPVSVLLVIINLFLFRITKRNLLSSIEKLNYAEDEEADAIEQKMSKMTAHFLLLASFSAILTIFFITETVDWYLVREAEEESIWFYLQIGAEILLSLVSCFCNISIYKIIKKTYHKEGEPGDKNWQKLYFESLDEAEQMAAYKASLNAMHKGLKGIIALMLVSLVANTLFHTGTFVTFILMILYIFIEVTYELSVIKERKVK